MHSHQLREEAQAILTQIRDTPDMQETLKHTRFCQVLALLVEIHNQTVESTARQFAVQTPRVGLEQIKLLQQAFDGDFLPLVNWLSPRVPYDPSLILSILP